MLLHTGPHADSLWRAWELEPGVVLPIAASGALYWRGYTRLRTLSRRGGDRLRRQAIAFALGMLALFLALESPLDAMADELFSMHMVQHLVLILVAAPLCVYAAPLVPMLWGLSPHPRARVTGAWQHSPAVRRAWSLLSAPGVVFVVHAAAIWIWHFPGPYQLALRSDAMHALEHLSFFGTALLFWWVVIQPVGHRRLDYAPGLLFVGGTLIQGGALGALLMFSPVAWYPAHAAGAAEWGMTTLADQQLAGLIMWIPASFVYVGAACALFLAWLREDEAAAARHGQTWRTNDALA